jgi:hypothetical protein
MFFLYISIFVSAEVDNILSIHLFILTALGFEVRALWFLTVWAFFVMDFFFKIGSHKLFLWISFKPTIVLISVFWVARITGMSHHTWLKFSFLNLLYFIARVNNKERESGDDDDERESANFLIWRSSFLLAYSADSS